MMAEVAGVAALKDNSAKRSGGCFSGRRGMGRDKSKDNRDIEVVENVYLQGCTRR
jgi:hypothetical protein